IDRGFPLIRATSTIAMGFISALRGQAKAGLEQLRQGLEFFGLRSATFRQDQTSRSRGRSGSLISRTPVGPPKLTPLPRSMRAYMWGYRLALFYELVGRPDEASAILLPAIEWTEKSGVKWELAPMHLLKGRLLVGEALLKEAENSFRTSIE